MITSVRKVPDAQDRFVLDGVAFYGRTYNEYAEMFNLQFNELQGKRVLDCASGPASFAAEAHRMRIHAIACDPMYVHGLQDLLPRAEEDVKLCVRKSDGQKKLFDKNANAAEKPDSHYVSEKQRALFTFSRDFTQGKVEGRYVAGSLPNLPFASNSFDLVLSAHLLFVYASRINGGMLEEDKFTLGFHIEAIKELIRVSRNEVRIYPLKGPNCQDNPLMAAVLAALNSEPVEVDLRPVTYKDIVGANTMLLIRKNKA